MNTILIIEDDLDLLELFKHTLEQYGFDTLTAVNGNDGFDKLQEAMVDLIITDIMLPEMDGIEFIDTLRHIDKDIPILVVSAKDSIDDKRIGFQIGADDYMVKPIDTKELILRVEALLRRSRIAQSNVLLIGQTVLDLHNFTIKTPETTDNIPQKEFLLLYKLLSYPDRIFTRQQLMDDIWGPESLTDERTVDVHIKRLRDRYKDCEDFEIKTIRGLGYKAVILQ